MFKQAADVFQGNARIRMSKNARVDFGACKGTVRSHTKVR